MTLRISEALNAVLGDLIEIRGSKKDSCQDYRNLPGVLREKSESRLTGSPAAMPRRTVGEVVRVKKIPRKTAATILVTPLDFTQVLPEESELEQFAKVLQGLPVMLGDKINIPFLGGKERLFQVEATSPSGGVIINQKTQIPLKEARFFPGGTVACLL